jgi:uncharacterized membrane protein
MSLARGWPAPVALGLAVAVAVAALIGDASTGRTLVVAVFVLLGPGLALVALLEIEDPWTILALAFGASVALDTAVALLLFYVTGWSADAGLAILVAVSAGAALAHAARAGREKVGGT